MKKYIVFLSLVIFIGTSIARANAIIIDFEDLTPPPQGILVRDEYQFLGVLFSGDNSQDSYSGRIYTSPHNGTYYEFGNSGPNVMDIGWRDEPTTATFVIPGTNTPTVATNISFLIGDGNLDHETFIIEMFDLNGNTLFSQSYTTVDNAELITCNDEVSSIRFTNPSFSPSGAVFDDFSFTLSSLTPIPEPSTFLLFLSCLLGMIGIRKRYN